ncbi:tumor necrosis factor receptor superfamily member 10B isoform 2-T2 [Geothlypis trichas]
MRWPRRGWLWLAALLLLLSAAPWESSAAALKKRDSLDFLDLGWAGEDDYYRKSDGLYCKRCPAGTYLTKECEEQGGSSTCQPCGLGEYMQYPNVFLSCQECSKCREDQVELSPCQPQRNTVCACRNGTFCPPEHPCEMCQKCQPRCPDGQVMLKPCKPESDLQCGPDTATVPSYLKGIIIAVTVVLAVIMIWIGTALCCWKRHCSSPGDGRSSSRRPYEFVVSSWEGRGSGSVCGLGQCPPVPLLPTWPAAPGKAGGAGDESHPAVPGKAGRARRVRLIQKFLERLEQGDESHPEVSGRLEEQRDEAHPEVSGRLEGQGMSFIQLGRLEEQGDEAHPEVSGRLEEQGMSFIQLGRLEGQGDEAHPEVSGRLEEQGDEAHPEVPRKAGAGE